MLDSALFEPDPREVSAQTLLEKHNSKTVRGCLTSGDLLVRQGAVVAYQGGVNISHEPMAFNGTGVEKFVKKAVNGEGLGLMRVSGDGELFLADMAADVHIIEITDDALSVNGMNVLAFSASLSWDIELFRSAGAVTGGLLNTTLSGTGQVAVSIHGSPITLDVGRAPTYADPDAVVCWSAGLATSWQPSMSSRDLVGRGSGESGQIAFSGQGRVIVQPADNTRYGGGSNKSAEQQQQTRPLGGLGRFLGS